MNKISFSFFKKMPINRWIDIAIFAFILIFPFLGYKQFRVDFMGEIMAYMIFALSLDLIWGFTGLMSLGHAVLFGMGGYIIGISYAIQDGAPAFMTREGITEIPLLFKPLQSPAIAVIIGLLVPTLFALFLGFFLFKSKVSGVFFTIITLALAQITKDFVINQQVYTNGFKAIEGLNLKIEEDEVRVIIGPNGAGKTTLVKSIIGLLPATEGQIYYCNEDVTKNTPSERSKTGIAYVPQGREILSDFTVEENLELGAMAHMINNRQPISKRKEIVFGYFPALKENLHRKGGVLSGGQQQQLAIGRALMSKPNMIILDEPTDGIQPNIVSELANILNRIHSELFVTIVIVEQNLKFAFKIANKYVMMQKGEIVSRGLTNELSEDTIKKYLSV